MSEERQVARNEAGGVEESAPPVDFAEPELAETLGTLATSLQAMVGFSFSGPMPPPSLLAEYEAVVPGLSHDIRDSWLDEQRHRRQMDDRDMTMREDAQAASIKLSSRGQWIATAFGASVMALAFYMFHKGEFNYSAALAIGSMLTFAIAFFTGNLPWQQRDKGNTPEAPGT